MILSYIITTERKNIWVPIPFWGTERVELTYTPDLPSQWWAFYPLSHSAFLASFFQCPRITIKSGVGSFSDLDTEWWRIFCFSDREIQFFELSSFEPYCQISLLETVPLRMDYCCTGPDECLILYGDTYGCINIIFIKSTGECLR